MRGRLARKTTGCPAARHGTRSSRAALRSHEARIDCAKEKPLSKSRLGHSVFTPLVLSLFWMAPDAAAAQSVTAAAPANSHARGYGSGWECDYGYRERAGLC